MKLPTAEQQRRGNKAAAEMFDASVVKTFEHVIDFKDYEFGEIVRLYLNDEIDSVTGIYLAMTKE